MSDEDGVYKECINTSLAYMFYTIYLNFIIQMEKTNIMLMSCY